MHLTSEKQVFITDFNPFNTDLVYPKLISKARGPKPKPVPDFVLYANNNTRTQHCWWFYDLKMIDKSEAVANLD